MKYDRSYYEAIWSRILQKYRPEDPVRDLGDLFRADIVQRVLRYIFTRTSCEVLQDYGAGNWLYLPTILDVCEHSGIFPRVDGFDYSQEALDYGKSRASIQGARVDKVRLQSGDLFEIVAEQEKTTVDLVLSLEVVEHVERDVDLIREFFRILRPGGYVVLSVPNKLPFPFSRNFFEYTFFRKSFTEKDVRVGHLRRYTRQTIEELMASQGFQVEKYIPYGFLLSDYAKPCIERGGWASSSLRALCFLEQKMGEWMCGERSEGLFLVCRKP